METQLTMAGQAAEPLFPPKKLKRLILPLIAEQLLAMMVGMADTVMITTVGEAAVSGVSLVDSISILIIQVLAALCTGGAVVVAQYLGRRDGATARLAAKQLIYITFLVGMALMTLSLTMHEGILRLVFGRIDADVMYHADTYFSIVAISFPFLAVYNGCAAIFRAMGNSKVSMFTSLIMNLVNISGNAILIYGYGWGAAGAATASLASRAIAAIVMLFLIRNPQNPVFLYKLWRVEFQPKIVKSILRIGVPNGLENGMFHFGKLMVQGLITTFGTVAIAAGAIVNSINGLMNVPGSAIGLSIITVVGQCLGAGEVGQAEDNAKKLIKLCNLCMAGMGLVLVLVAPWLVTIFNLSPEAMALAKDLLRSLGVATAIFWTMSFPFANILRAGGDARYTMVVSVSSMWICRIGLSYLFALTLGLGMQGVWYAMFADWIVRGALFVPRYRSGKWRAKSVI